MLAIKRLAGVTPEVNLEEHLLCMPLPILNNLTLKPRGDVTRSKKQGYQWPHKKGLMCSKNYFKNLKNNNNDSKRYDKCKFTLKLVRYLTVSNSFPLKVIQNYQNWQLCERV